MRLFSRLLIPTYFALCSGSVFSMDNWWLTVLSEQPYQQIQRTLKSGGSWSPCESDLIASKPTAEILCLDDFHYYRLNLYGEVAVGNKMANFVFLMTFEWQNWNDLILNLRKDGFVMSSMKFDDAEYDVVSALEQKSAEDVDKEVILMMNRYPPEARRTIHWVRSNEFNALSPHLKLSIQSDGDMIEVRVTRL